MWHFSGHNWPWIMYLLGLSLNQRNIKTLGNSNYPTSVTVVRYE